MDDNEILKKWEEYSDLTLDESKYSEIVIEGVNSYVALDIDGGKKSRGRFSTPKIGDSLKAHIIPEAIENYIFKGVGVAETILSCNDIRAFLYSAKTDKRFKVEWNGEEAQNINRFVMAKSNEGACLERVSNDGKRAKIKVQKVFLVNDLNQKIDMGLVDKTFYIKEAESRLSKLLMDQRVEELRNSNELVVQDLKNKGFYPVPKNYKVNPKGITKKDSLETKYDYEKCPTIAIRTGKNVGIICIDVDVPELLPVELKELLAEAKSLVSYVVDEGGQGFDTTKRHKVFFKCDTTKLKQKAYLGKYGYEILYNKPANITGAYDYKRNYVYKGEICELPKELEHFLTSVQKMHTTKKVTGASGPSSPRRVVRGSDFVEFIEGYFNSEQMSFNSNPIVRESLRERFHEEVPNAYEIECPFKDEHTSYSSPNAMVFVKSNGSIEVKCFHSSCWDSLRDFNNELNKHFQNFLNSKNTYEGLEVTKPVDEMTEEEVLDLYE